MRLVSLVPETANQNSPIPSDNVHAATKCMYPITMYSITTVMKYPVRLFESIGNLSKAREKKNF